MNDDYDQILKIVMTGSESVGKSNILLRFTKNGFNPHEKPTIGGECGSRVINIGELDIRAQIWDTAGSERFKAISSAYYRGAVGALLVYDVTKQMNYESLDGSLKEIANNTQEDMVIMLVGNKMDLDTLRLVPTDIGMQYAQDNNLLFMETSAFSGQNIDQAFTQVIEKIISINKKKAFETSQKEQIQPQTQQPISLTSKKLEKKDKKKCC